MSLVFVYNVVKISHWSEAKTTFCATTLNIEISMLLSFRGTLCVGVLPKILVIFSSMKTSMHVGEARHTPSIPAPRNYVYKHVYIYFFAAG